MIKKLKLVFAGTPEFAVPSLQALLGDDQFEILAVFTQPDRPAGRGQKLVSSPVKVVAEQAGLPVFQPEKLDSAEITRLLELKPDFIVVVAYGLILPKTVLELPKFGCVNVHASLLPKYRGASPIQQAILNGDAETGVSFIKLVENLDAGPIYSQEILELNGSETTEELTVNLAELGGQKLPKILARIATNELQSQSQIETEATICRKVKKQAGQIDWREDTANLIECKLRAYTPWPGIFTEFKNQQLKITDLEVIRAKPVGKQLGEVFESEGKIQIATKDGAISLKKVQLAGRKEMIVEDFVRGETEFVDSRLG